MHVVKPYVVTYAVFRLYHPPSRSKNDRCSPMCACHKILCFSIRRPSPTSSVCLTPPRRSRLRAPPRVLGWTKTQILDFFMRTNAGICACISFSAIPFMVWWGYRYAEWCSCLAFFSRHPGCSAFSVHHPTWPLSGGGILDTSLQPGGRVWGCLGSKLWWGGTGIQTLDLLHASQES